MIGLMEEVLRNRFGAPDVVGASNFLEYRWHHKDERRRSVLLKTNPPYDERRYHESDLELIYNDAIGGFLLGGSLKMSILGSQEVFGLYSINNLQCQPEVCRANCIDPDICFFMDSANVWFYGAKLGILYVYDAATGELDDLGSLAIGLETIVQEYDEI